MTLSQELASLIGSGVTRIGELSIEPAEAKFRYHLCHWRDSERSKLDSWGGLEIHEGPHAARDISTFADDGSYRFSKAQENLKGGWLMLLETPEDLRFALDQFYPASLGVYLAHQRGTLEIENLRAKLKRQTGMYRFARAISDTGAQRLVADVCGPAHQCARKILWQIDSETPLDDTEASRFNGIVGNASPSQAIPLLCREACNHFVAECRRVSKSESAQRHEQAP
jgi:sirohydrochlorin cobaltochelatase